ASSGRRRRSSIRRRRARGSASRRSGGAGRSEREGGLAAAAGAVDRAPPGRAARGRRRRDVKPEIVAKVAAFPTGPGVYVFEDAAGKALYVGKAANLRARVRSYLRPGGDGRPMLR